jgi:uncharacterized protein (TIGR02231 family)
MNNYKYTQVGRILVEVSCEKSTQANFKFSFFSRLASWFPKYNVKANSGDDHMDVDYHAMVTQSTGVDWTNVKLTLSTTRPLYNNQKPELHPWYIDFYQAQRSRAKSRADAPSVYGQMEEVQMDSEQGVVGNSVESNGAYPLLKLEKSASYSSGNQVLNALNTSYEISRKYTVPSNNARKQVFIKQIEIPAVFNHYAVPSMEKDAFLTASITDWESYDLVPGNATIFYNNTYVGKSYIFSKTAEDTLQVSLGRDQGVSVEREKVKDLCTHNKMGSNVKKNYVYEIVLKNTNKESVTMVVYDRVPVSRKKEIMVNIGGLSGGEFNPETGIIKWTKTLSPGEGETFRFDYAVKYPKGSNINL